jgi:glycosyltransferase involved in cell wall biosynthesis
MSLLEIVDVARASLDDQPLEAAYIDAPATGDRVEAKALTISGWAIGRDGPVALVNVLIDGVVHERIPVRGTRRDVAEHFPARSWAGTSGFRGAIDVLGLTVSVLRVEAVLAGGGSAALADIVVRTVWPEVRHPSERDVVSIVIPCFNQAHYLGEAIESALAQTHPGIEVVVIDDGSTDNTIEVTARYPSVRYVRQDNRGLPAARNTGVRRSTGEYLVFLDADDRLGPEAVAVHLDHFQARPECAFVHGRFRHIGVSGAPIESEASSPAVGQGYAALLRGNHIGMHATVMYRRAVFKAVGGFDESLTACEDYDLYLRIARLFPLSSHEAIVAEYRQHGDSMSADHFKMLRTALAVLRRQQPHLGADVELRAAYAEGIRAWQRYYGKRILTIAEANLRRRSHRLTGLRAVARLARYAPGELLRVLPRMLRHRG